MTEHEAAGEGETGKQCLFWIREEEGFLDSAAVLRKPPTV